MTGRRVWTKYAAIAVGIHAMVLCLPISRKAPRMDTDKEKVIDVVLIRQEEPPPPLLSLREKPLPVRPGPPKGAPVIREQAPVQESVKPPEKVEKKEQSGPAGAGNVLDEQIVSQVSPGPSPAKGEVVNIAGVIAGGGKVGLGSGGTGSGRGAGGTGSGTGGGSGGGGEGDPVEAWFGQSDGPRFLHHEIPEYPFAAKRRKKEGKVVLMLTIDEKGKLIKTDVVETTDQVFVQCAVEALKRSTFLPARRKGVPIACRATLPVRFEIQE